VLLPKLPSKARLRPIRIGTSCPCCHYQSLSTLMNHDLPAKPKPKTPKPSSQIPPRESLWRCGNALPPGGASASMLTPSHRVHYLHRNGHCSGAPRTALFLCSRTSRIWIYGDFSAGEFHRKIYSTTRTKLKKFKF
jgi:hypothetical protein